jgi:hypothetical protein
MWFCVRDVYLEILPYPHKLLVAYEQKIKWFKDEHWHQIGANAKGMRHGHLKIFNGVPVLNDRSYLGKRGFHTLFKPNEALK